MTRTSDARGTVKRVPDRMNNRQLIERYAKAHTEQDWAAVSEMTAPDLVVT